MQPGMGTSSLESGRGGGWNGDREWNGMETEWNGMETEWNGMETGSEMEWTGNMW